MRKIKEPSFIAVSVVHLSEKDSGIDKQIVRVSLKRVTAAGNDPKKLRRRQAVELINQDNGLSTMAFVMGGRVANSAVAIDYDARHALGLKYEDDHCAILVRPAAKYRVVRHYLTHADLGYRLSIQLGLLGAALGGISIIKDLIGWFVG